MTPSNHDPVQGEQVVLPQALSPERTTQLLIDLGRIRELVAECIVSPSDCKEALICRQIREVSLPLYNLSLARVVEVLNSGTQCADEQGVAVSTRRLKAYAAVVDDVVCYIENLRDGYQGDDGFLENIEDKMALSDASLTHYAKPCLQNCPVDVMAEFLDGVGASLRDIRSVLSQWEAVPNHPPLASEFLRHLHALKGAVLVYGVEELVSNIQYLESCAVAFLKGELKASERLFELMNRYVARMNVVTDLLEQQAETVLMTNEAVLPMSGVLPERVEPLQDAAQPEPGLPLAQKLPRLRFLVERASIMLGKSVRLMVTGEDVVLPAELIGKLIAPLELLLWNAIDHGIETPTVRAEAGKSKDGVITLSLTLDQDRSMGVITVADDGAGIDEEAVREKALLSGYVTSNQEAQQAALSEMIFHPGLSTSLVVSPVSGRGMGLDVVNTEVSRLGGHVEVQTARGQGASFTLSVPL
ncbi:MAG: ATP-binding protein [Gammaproteobacteria bacterium]|nr:ATP-binding protein [Gammaproteobacteria bacterium]